MKEKTIANNLQVIPVFRVRIQKKNIYRVCHLRDLLHFYLEIPKCYEEMWEESFKNQQIQKVLSGCWDIYP